MSGTYCAVIESLTGCGSPAKIQKEFRFEYPKVTGRIYCKFRASMTQKNTFTVGLVGPGHQENLPLAYLDAALQAAGYASIRVRYDDHHDKENCISTILRENPPLLGVSVAFQFSVMEMMALMTELRRRGYKGHITCGGHVPTFCYDGLLNDCSALDSVVRHEGEETLVALCRALESNQGITHIPGLVSRGAEGFIGADRTAPLQDVDTLHPPQRPDALFRIGGVPVSFILTSRGCVGECHYCSISAFNRSAHGPRYRLRHPELVADEVGYLYHEMGARVFFVQDDLFVLPNEKKTLERIGALTAALKRKRVDNAMFWIKGRPESITPGILSDAWQMGARHLFLGVEHSVDERLSYLGRRHCHRHNLTAIKAIYGAKMRPSFNLMIFDPDCSLEDVASVMDFARAVGEIPWNICRTEVYPGTTLYQKLIEEHRLTGDYRTFGYTMKDTRAELLFRILRVSLHEHAFHEHSLLNKLISLSFSRQIHEQFLPGTLTSDISSAVDQLIVESHTATCAAISEAIRYVQMHGSSNPAAMRRFAAQQAAKLGAEDTERLGQVQHLWEFLAASGEAIFGRVKKGYPQRTPQANQTTSRSV